MVWCRRSAASCPLTFPGVWVESCQESTESPKKIRRMVPVAPVPDFGGEEPRMGKTCSWMSHGIGRTLPPCSARI